MPIYAYRCSTCGHAKDVLRKISDPPLTVCPACGAATFVKQVTAAGFQLKGSGWYVTDFRDSASKKPGKAADGAGATAEPTARPSAEAAPTNGTKADARQAGRRRCARRRQDERGRTDAGRRTGACRRTSARQGQGVTRRRRAAERPR